MQQNQLAGTRTRNRIGDDISYPFRAQGYNCVCLLLWYRYRNHQRKQRNQTFLFNGSTGGCTNVMSRLKGKHYESSDRVAFKQQVYNHMDLSTDWLHA